MSTRWGPVASAESCAKAAACAIRATAGSATLVGNRRRRSDRRRGAGDWSLMKALSTRFGDHFGVIEADSHSITARRSG